MSSGTQDEGGAQAPARDAQARAMASPRIALMASEVADQIAAGEVVERPASVVKELVDNAIDAGAGRVEVVLEGGGLRSIRVIDDGAGIHPDDLELALTRHATSKLRRAEELLDVATLGFRGEALASIAAVGLVRLSSRRQGAPNGATIEVGPGRAPTLRPRGMAHGTQIEVGDLFGSIPARRKFMRAPATEVGHCVEAVLRIAAAHPGVHLSLSHEGRVALDLPARDRAGRVHDLLRRRGVSQIVEIAGEAAGVGVEAWIGVAPSAKASRAPLSVVVRGRVVRERNVAQIVALAWSALRAGAGLPEETVGGYVFVEPARGSVDVNVHPQKHEVRFSEPQAIYAAIRQVFAESAVAIPAADAEIGSHAPDPDGRGGEARDAWARRAMDRWAGDPTHASEAAHGGRRYSLGTRATQGDYASHKRSVSDSVRTLAAPRRDAGVATDMAHETAMDALFDAMEPPVDEADTRGAGEADGSASARAAGETWTLLACLAGGVAIFLAPPPGGALADAGEVWAIDVLKVRNELILRRLLGEPGGAGHLSQRLLSPRVVALGGEEVSAVVAVAAELDALGLAIEAFGSDAVVVRGVPAALAVDLDEAGIDALVERARQWARLGHKRDRHVLADAWTKVSAPAVSGRLARRVWRDYVRGVPDLAELDALDGVVRWTAAALVCDLRGGASGRGRGTGA